MDERVTLREAFDQIADAFMDLFGMKNSPLRERLWNVLKEALEREHARR